MKIVTVVGARPQFVKAAVLRKRFLETGVEEILVHTDQHYDPEMSDVFFSELNIASPDYHLNLKNRTHGGMTGEILGSVEDILMKEKPDYCLVYGDTNSTIAGALAAAKMHIPVCHVEAGLRSFNKSMPEEINRILTDHISKYLFCSTSSAIQNLKNENILDGVYHVGDIMYDAVLGFTKSLDFKSIVDGCVDRNSKKMACMTLHRQENVNEPDRLAKIIDYCNSLTDEYQIVFPIHPNTANKLKQFAIPCGDISVIDPQPYLTMQALLGESDLVLTDSGGLQKEAYFHQTRCITLRDETEWVETVSSGWNKLWQSDTYVQDPEPILEYGKGDAGKRIVEILFQNHQDLDKV